jgi:transcriptional regulator with XRE-family HTH domain
METKSGNNSICVAFSQRMSQLLERDGKSRKDVCRDLDIKYTTFCDWINGRNIPKAPQIERLCDYFCVEPSYFFIETEPENAAERFTNRVSRYAKMLQHKTLEDMKNEVEERTRIDCALDMIKDGALSLDKIAQYTKLPLAKVKELATK